MIFDFVDCGIFKNQCLRQKIKPRTAMALNRLSLILNFSDAKIPVSFMCVSIITRLNLMRYRQQLNLDHR